jgi:hypothetical protein
MEYSFYTEQKYLFREGRVEARILTAAEAERLGYEDGYAACHDRYKLYVDGFNSEERARMHLLDLANCTIMPRKDARAKERGAR